MHSYDLDIKNGGEWFQDPALGIPLQFVEKVRNWPPVLLLLPPLQLLLLLLLLMSLLLLPPMLSAATAADTQCRCCQCH